MKYTKVPALFAKLTEVVGAGRFVLLPELGSETQLIVRCPQTVGDVASDADWLLHGQGGWLAISKGRRFLQALTGIDVEAAPLGSMREWLCAQALAKLPSGMLPLVSRIAGRNQTETLSAVNLLQIELTLRTDDHALVTHAYADAETLLNWLAQVPSAYCESRVPQDWQDIRVSVAPLVAAHRLTLGQVHGLAKGDIVLPERAWFNTDGAGEISLAGRRLQVSYVPDAGFELLDLQMAATSLGSDAALPQYEENKAMDEQGVLETDMAQGGTLSTLSEVAIELRFELDTLSLRLSELSQLAVGSVLTLDGVCPPHVWLRAGGRCIGRGEIVDVDGRLGVQITSRVPA